MDKQAQGIERSDMQSLSDKALLARVGTTGSLFNLAVKHTYMAWGFAFAMLLVNILQAGFYILRPQATLMVNEKNQIIGQYDYLNAYHREDEDLIHTASTFIDGIISTNATTIFKDRGRAIDMMTVDYKAQYLADAKETKEIVDVRDAKQKSFTQFDYDAASVKRFGDFGENAYVRLVGKVEIGNIDPNPFNFDITVEVNIVPKTRLNRYGVEVINYVFN